MLAVARQVDLETLPGAIARFAPPGQVFLTAGHQYRVFAVAVFKGQAFLQVVDDLKHPAWLPALLFDLEETTLPPDWICSVFREEPTLLLGPDFVAKDLAAYKRMVELEPDAVELFWKRVEDRTQSGSG